MSIHRSAVAPAAALLLALVVAGCAASPEAAPTSTTPPSPTRATETPAPSPTPTSEATAPTCENTVTAEFTAMMVADDWVGWTLPHNGIGESPFADFPQGVLAEAPCRWGAGPDVATDNIEDLAWASLTTEQALAAQDQLAAQGYRRSEAPEGVYFSAEGEAGWEDGAGLADTFLFTRNDVRWAMFKDRVRFVKAPDEAA